VENQFQYRVFFMFLDLARLSELSHFHPLWSGAGVNLAYFRRRDHMGDPRIPLDHAIRNLVLDKTGHRLRGPIRMLAHLRYMGYCFNPATFYYCFDKGDQNVETIVVEIHNTPWGERHQYILSLRDNEHPSGHWRRHRFVKGFHVSPFMDMDIYYDWRFRVPGERINVHMINIHDGRKIFDASLALVRREVTRRNLTRVLAHYPAMTARVIFLIYWQALKLLIKGAPFFDHPRADA
jgi:DUF1365 family protein